MSSTTGDFFTNPDHFKLTFLKINFLFAKAYFLDYFINLLFSPLTLVFHKVKYLDRPIGSIYQQALVHFFPVYISAAKSN
jgi:hypothetical protein